MATYVKYSDFVEQLCRGKHDFGSHTFKVALSNGTPSAAHAKLSDITELSTANGYTAGGATTTDRHFGNQRHRHHHRNRSGGVDSFRQRYHVSICRALQRHCYLAGRCAGCLLGQRLVHDGPRGEHANGGFCSHPVHAGIKACIDGG